MPIVGATGTGDAAASEIRDTVADFAEIPAPAATRDLRGGDGGVFEMGRARDAALALNRGTSMRRAEDSNPPRSKLSVVCSGSAANRAKSIGDFASS